jgi:uncharacterized protein (TIGR00290 family)
MWSGGKDSALALHRARTSGMEVARLITFYDAATNRVRFHATRIQLLQAQAAAAGAEIQAIGSSWREMEERLMEALAQLRAEGFAGVVLGDIHLADVRAWYEERVTAVGLQHVEPIWGEPPAELVREFVQSGGRAVVTCVDLGRLDPSWLGRTIDQQFAEEIATTDIDPCGENGEYHSFAFQGPVFSHPVRWRPGRVRSEGRFSQLDLLRP